MKFNLLHIVLMCVFLTTNAQITKNLESVDSIQKQLKLLKTNDSLEIAGKYFQIGEIYRKSLLGDSAYHYLRKAEKLFKTYNSKYESAMALYGIAVSQTYDKDYTGSELTSTEARAILNELPPTNNVNMYKAYIFNNLGIVYDELEQFEESINYYEKSLQLKRSLEGDFERSIGLTLNNLLKVYRRAGKYNLAIEKFNEIVANKNLIKNYPDVYVLALGNYAYTLYQSKNHEQLPGLYLKALKISDSIGGRYNSIILHQHLAEFYNDLNKKDSAKYYGYKAKALSEEFNNDDLLKSLRILSKIETGEIAANHLRNYVVLNDSLQKIERARRDKFARIRFETKQIEQENIRINKERMWLLIITIVIIITSFLLYLIILQRNKNKELQFAQKQQASNEEIYNLMLSQNESIEEARTLEKKRISEELHDGVLGRLFGTRLSLDSLNMNNTEQAIKTRSQYINELKAIEEDIRKVSHELNTDFVSGAGFIDIIKTLVETQTSVYNLKYKLLHDDTINWDAVANKNKIHIYRIIQETLHNIHKHANALFVKISFKLKNNVICLTLEDNGNGFDVDKAKSGIGLKNMTSRIKDIKGKLNITSTKNKGTTVTIEVPIA